MSERIDAIKQTLAESRRYLDSVLDAVGDRWEQQVYSDGLQWTVRQLVNHLVDADKGHNRMAMMIAEGQEAIPEDFDVERYNKSVTRKMADKPASQARDELLDSRQQLMAWLEELGEAKLDRKGRHASLHIMTVEQILQTQAIHERGHAEDIAQVLGIQVSA